MVLLSTVNSPVTKIGTAQVLSALTLDFGTPESGLTILIFIIKRVDNLTKRNRKYLFYKMAQNSFCVELFCSLLHFLFKYLSVRESLFSHLML